MTTPAKPDTAKPLFADHGCAPAAPERFANSDNIEITPEYEGFNQHNDMFSRGLWDSKFATRITMRFYRSFVKPKERVRDEEGFAQEDFALRNGPWVVTEMFAEMQKAKDRRDGFTDDFTPHLPPKVEPADMGDPKSAAKRVKKTARIYGADLVGITAYDPRWTYRSKFSGRTMSSKPVEIPEGITNVIVVGKSMQYDLVRMSPTATAATSAAAGYAEDAVTLLALAQYIRSLGYQAIANQNDTNLAIPYAIQAGLGEYGRNGLCITREFGPRVRFGRILTDMPLAHDTPLSFGVEQTCEICRRCANNCPPQAIDHGPPSTYTFNQSNIKGIKKWTTDGEKCFKFWVLKGSDCANCIRTCPYNKDYTRLWSKIMRRLLATPLRRLALILDDKMRLHDQIKPSSWWRSENGRFEVLEKAKDHAPMPDLKAQQDRVKAIRDARKEKEAQEAQAQ
ncbi:reductive dehalogenase [Aestuariivita sp.]|uniref:reductive dehalogenase n=1 Tax=Aestuariivita sp. TaxID=1872407 RepID=UPI002173857B|nr:reductive dehalogenase [Aestuariivita sp.]MCE8005594.1 reductive dehalogenase [Aestuariivita sp.]